MKKLFILSRLNRTPQVNSRRMPLQLTILADTERQTFNLDIAPALRGNASSCFKFMAIS